MVIWLRRSMGRAVFTVGPSCTVQITGESRVADLNIGSGAIVFVVHGKAAENGTLHRPSGIWAVAFTSV